jgi:hypothetical protein
VVPPSRGGGAQPAEARSTGLGNSAPETRGCSPRRTATSSPDPRQDHACAGLSTTIERAEIVALLFNVSDIASSLARIERLLGEDDGEEEADGS